MTPYPRRLIEVDLPIKRISAHARREKSIRHGHISTLHIWWARRPLAACRAVLCASLWPDPADAACPETFRHAARTLMQTWARDHLKKLSPESYPRFNRLHANPALLDDNVELQGALLDFIADFANWDHATDAAYLAAARSLTQAGHEALGGLPGTRPLVVDPFAGGGAIPLEALRIGADAFASDLNPVAVLLNRVVLEYIPKYGRRLADEVRHWGAWIKDEAEKELAVYYPKDPDGATPIAYLWARTVVCEGPGCGAQIPLMRSLWLAKKGRRSIALRIKPDSAEKRVDFEIVENASARDMAEGTVKRGSATCPCCGYTTPVESVRRQLKTRRGGAHDARLFAVVTTRPGQQGRFYRLPTAQDLETTRQAAVELERRKAAHTGPLSLVPNEHLPLMSGVFNVPLYGHNTWGSLFTPRQALALTTLTRLVKKARTGMDRIDRIKDDGLADAVQTCLAMALNKQADSNSSLCAWRSTSQDIGHTFGRQALPILWDFVEGNVFSGATRDWLNAVEGSLKSLESLDTEISGGHAENASATAHPLSDDAANAFITDPPYYNAVPYADLSDFFYVWLRRTIGTIYPDLFESNLSPKDQEICEMAGWDPERYRHKDRYFFERTMAQAMAEGRRILNPAGIGLVVFAHKSTSGWEAQLQSMIDAGWTITGSWPIDTEMGSRLRAMNSAALASSIHLVCRPRENPDGSLRTDDVGDWRDVLAELPRRIHEWMPRLAAEGVVGADAIFACLGPALEVFSRYSSVEKASGEQVALREYLEYVWAAVAREALGMVFEGGDATGFEEDARLTAMWLWTLSSGNGNGQIFNRDEQDRQDENEEEETTGPVKAAAGYTLEYDAARKIAQGLGAHLEQLERVVEVKGDKARLLSVAERADTLFSKEEIQSPGAKHKKSSQLNLFAAGVSEEPEQGWNTDELISLTHGETALDRVHQSMILFAAGRSDALRRLLVEDGAGRDQRFWRLAQALSALYPAHSDEKRYVDGVLARKKGLGF